ncbi:AarF/ABC1/UbiB kinase family protein [Flavobacterium arcticum]|uniref:AarF/ABC1/UbiB kinase family protein n=1 Tax=Flavobacterium arcticum TaxID=1784713 RepID=A0A345H967_9FLAO|nr:AarF/ABC1/UbiB kinase family protein [Flavobacterium arcticum]AXG73127.1 AarF/ABC1/UbiB kinase family protein [Flavobacterium arcticum]KAF2512918.1 AarF/ABC1/UbiB kinase family protein [Flavobacterium arcticum]
MKRLDSIPTNKIERVTKLVSTGVKIGGNYLKYYGQKMVNPELTKDGLHEDNATDIYDGLKELKGSALKVAQMLSMEKNLLPQSYVEKFSLSQFSVPPLSPPLVMKTFKKYFGVEPYVLFDEFDSESINAASIGQVHKAKKNGKDLAVKIQYPGVRDSIGTDIAMVKPIALRMFNLKGTSDEYFQEVEDKLMEETDYTLELQQSEIVREACSNLDNIIFPKYYPELSCEKIITMDWMQGKHLSEWCKEEHSQEERNKVGQALYDFYMYQIHVLHKFHADPHPGNFLVDENAQLIAIDFGCMKELPKAFYTPYFELIQPETLDNDTLFTEKLIELDVLKTDDTPKEYEYFKALFHELLTVFVEPYRHDHFDFSQEIFSEAIAGLSDRFANDKNIRKMNTNRGSKHFIYVNRTFFGLYSLLFDIKANVAIRGFEKYLK